MKNFWVSWTSEDPTDFEMFNPWWCTGWMLNSTLTNGVLIFCAAIKAEMAGDAAAHIIDAYESDPKAIKFRFCEERPEGWSPFCDRFPKADWMEWR